MKNIIFILLSIPSHFLKAFVLMKLWAWFAVPIFGIAPIGMALAFGLSVLVGLLTYQFTGSPTENEYDHYMTGAIAYAYVVPLVALLIGFITTLFL